jgi:hypothetical protein
MPAEYPERPTSGSTRLAARAVHRVRAWRVLSWGETAFAYLVGSKWRARDRRVAHQHSSAECSVPYYPQSYGMSRVGPPDRRRALESGHRGAGPPFPWPSAGNTSCRFHRHLRFTIDVGQPAMASLRVMISSVSYSSPSSASIQCGRRVRAVPMPHSRRRRLDGFMTYSPVSRSADGQSERSGSVIVRGSSCGSPGASKRPLPSESTKIGFVNAKGVKSGRTWR